MRRKQSGFTLVEIAIVLIIIGLLLGGVLKGQELIHSAKVKNLITDFRSVTTFVYAYQDRFRALPGDDRDAVGHVGALANGTVTTLGNGRINGNWNSAAANNAPGNTDESARFWEQIRRAGLASGDPMIGNPGYIYTNADGGNVGITSDPVFTGAGSWPATFYVCSAGVQGRYARQIDTAMDDGNTSTGSVRVLGTAAGGELATSATVYQALPADDATLFTVCVAY